VPEIELIVFDCDGVILESMDIKTRAFGDLFMEWGREAARMMVEYHVERGGISRYRKFEHFYREYLGNEIPPEEMKRLDEKFTALCIDAVLKAPFVPGAYEFIVKNYKRWPLFVASGAPQPELRDILARREMTGYFKGVYGSPRTKPEILAEIIARHQVSPDRALMIGDSRSDLDAAKAVGTRFFGRGPFPEPWHWEDDLTGLEKFLDNAK